MTERPGREPAAGPPDAAQRRTDAQDDATHIPIEKRADARDSSVRRGLDDAKQRVEDAARRARGAVESEVEKEAEHGRHAAAHRVDTLARALRRAGDALESEGEEDLGRYGRETAERVERFGDYLDRRDVNGLVHDLEGTARSNPAAFIGSTFAAGLLLGRFLRSSSPSHTDGRAQDETERREDTTLRMQYGYEGAAAPDARREATAERTEREELR